MYKYTLIKTNLDDKNTRESYVQKSQAVFTNSMVKNHFTKIKVFYWDIQKVEIWIAAMHRQAGVTFLETFAPQWHKRFQIRHIEM